MQEVDEKDDLGEETTPFTHAQIGKMLNDAERAPVKREYPVDLSYFLGFGDAGTPSGMIGSHAGHGSPVVGGSCGDAPRVKPRPPRVEARAPRGPAQLEEAFYPWGPAPAELGGEAPVPQVASQAPEPAPLPWTLPNAVASPAAPPVVEGFAQEPARERIEALDEDLRGAGLRSHVGLFIVGGALLACGLGVFVWWLTRPEPPPPPEPEPPVQIAMVDNDYGEKDDEDDEDDEGETGAAEGPARERTKGTVTLDDPGEIKTVPASKTQHCITQRDRAEQALLEGKWPQLEELSRETSCWRPSRKARVLRMNALFELGRLDKCIKVGNGQNHKDIKKWIKLCSHGRG